MGTGGILGLLAVIIAYLAYLAVQPARTKTIVRIGYLLNGKAVAFMQVTPDAPLQLQVVGFDKVGNQVGLPAGASVQSVSADPTIATASQSGDGKTVTVSEVKIGNTMLNGTATLSDNSTITGSVSIECVGGVPTSLGYVPLASARR